MVAPSFEVLEHGFPGKWLAAVAFILGPALLLAGAILMIPFEEGSFEDRQEALASEPTRASVALELFTAGWMATLVVIFALASLIRAKKPGLGMVAGIFAIGGVTVSLFFAGVMSYEIGLAGLSDRAMAAEAEAGSYAPAIILLSGGGIVGGWALLGWGSHAAGVVRPLQAVGIGMVALLPVAVLGGFPALIPLPFVGMAVGLVPLGVAMLRAPSASTDPSSAAS